MFKIVCRSAQLSIFFSKASDAHTQRKTLLLFYSMKMVIVLGSILTDYQSHWAFSLGLFRVSTRLQSTLSTQRISVFRVEWSWGGYCSKYGNE